MERDKAHVVQQIEDVLKDIGGFSWEQAETWASFCFAVGMDPLPQLKVMLNNICDVVTPSGEKVPDRSETSELWIEKKGHKVKFKIVGPF